MNAKFLNHKSVAPQIANDTLLDDEFAIALKMITAPITEDLATISRIRQGCQNDRRNIEQEGPW